jgi:hypothetical protein
MQRDVRALGEQPPVPVEISRNIAAVLKAIHDVGEVGCMAEAEGVTGFVHKGQEDDSVPKQRIRASRGVGLRQNIDFRALLTIHRHRPGFAVEAGSGCPVDGQTCMLGIGAFREDDPIARFTLPRFEGPSRKFGIVFVTSRTCSCAGAIVYPPGPHVCGVKAGGKENRQYDESHSHAGIVTQTPRQVLAAGIKIKVDIGDYLCFEIMN